MRRPAWGALLGGALALAGCTGAGRTPAAAPARLPIVILAGADVAVSARLVAARARDAEVIYLGELHDNPLHHAIQTRILEALLLDGRRPALAFEMVPETRQAALDDAVRGGADAAEVARQLGWSAQGWPDFTMYWPLFELARRNELPAVGADLDPAVTRRISRDGLGAAGEFPARLRSALPDDPARDQAIARRIRAAHCDQISESRAERMLESWYARNVVIARRVGSALERVPQVVVIIGRGHQSQGGVPEQLDALRPGTRQFVVALLEGEPAPPAEITADVVWLTPTRPRPNPCLTLPQRLGAAR
ncbi:MAG TPA: ChaN family lipoprotein [Methylomirabilota bacterium]|jgi:uncharacterized iron-regulated protein|nr:ChaN family lipoprotein [Methylomirabilota bacterium]